MDLSRLPFDTIHPIRMTFDTYNKLLLYFHLSEITWYLIGFHDNHRYINDVTSVRNLGLSNFQIQFEFIAKLLVFSDFLAKS